MTRALTVAAAQLGPSSPSKPQTIERMVVLMEEAGKQGVELVVFPELALSPYFATKVQQSWEGFFEETLPSPVTRPLFEAARRAKLHWVLPYAEREKGKRWSESVSRNSAPATFHGTDLTPPPVSVEPAREPVDAEQLLRTILRELEKSARKAMPDPVSAGSQG